jgi:hypothetical protein
MPHGPLVDTPNPLQVVNFAADKDWQSFPGLPVLSASILHSRRFSRGTRLPSNPLTCTLLCGILGTGFSGRRNLQGGEYEMRNIRPVPSKAPKEHEPE